MMTYVEIAHFEDIELHPVDGAKGNAYDNAAAESFFGILKCETIYLQKVRTLSDLIRTIDQYVFWYNHHRINLTIGGYSPIQFRLMNHRM
jgi:transposase InsO family protein